MKLYLAGPMTGIKDLNFPAFHAEAKRLRALGYEIVNPAELNADQQADWNDCMRVDIKVICDCDGLAIMDDWQGSDGASLEQHTAFWLGLPIFRARSLRSPCRWARLEPGVPVRDIVPAVDLMDYLASWK